MERTPDAARSDLRDLLQIFEVFPTGVLLLDSTGGVLRINEIAQERLGRPELEVLGQDLFRELLPELEEDGTGAEYRAGMEHVGVSLGCGARVGTGEGERRLWLEVRSFRFHDADWGLVLLEDRTRLMRERERRRRAERLAAVGELAAGVGHEVNNPLASIKSFAQLLARDVASAEHQRALEIIIEESDRIARVVESLLTFARQQGISGREPVNLSTVVEQVLALQRYALDTAGIEVRRDLDHSLSLVMGEAGALQQLVLNLVVNAEQALAGREESRLLIVRTRESSEGVILSVVDNGPGIPRDALPHLFESQQGAPAQGVGLGVAATIVREHGGQIFAESEEGRGSAFFVRLPRSAVAAAPAAAPRAPAEQARRLRVLVADDEPTLRLAITLFLGRRGHDVTQAADAHEALRLAQEQEFDAALVDARMPGDGLALLEKLEQMPGLRGRTALMTGDMGRARSSQGITTGRPYLIKPFDMMDAVNLIEKLGQ